jgi:hypothetical protein
MGSFGTPSREAENGFVAARLCFVAGVGTKQRLPGGVLRPETGLDRLDSAKERQRLARKMPPR